jgi:Kunitz/Bovine pancreatic trypsin inhibitor domain
MVYMKRLVKSTIVLLTLLLTQCKDDCSQSNSCSLLPDAGSCEAIITKYYYDKEAKECRPFTYGGCDGVVPFDTSEECKNACHCDLTQEQ